MELSIVILNYKLKDLVRNCLMHIYRHPPSISFEVIVVDNDSGDDVESVIKDFPGVRCIQNGKNIGYAAGNNRGLQQASGKMMLIMNPDIIVLPKSIDALYHYMEQHPGVGLAGPQLLYPDYRIQDSCYRYPTWKTPIYRRTSWGQTQAGKSDLDRYLMKDFDHKQTKSVDWLMGACLIVKRSALEKVGLLDEQFFLYYEDTDWSRRFWQAGFSVMYVVESQMIHFHQRGSDSGSFWKSLRSKGTRIHIASAFKYFWKYRKEL